MKKTFKTISLVLALSMVLMVALTGCQKEEATADGLVKVTVSEVTHSVFYAPQYVAVNLGFFEEAGIEIDLFTGEGADAVMAAVLSGSVDVGFAGPEASIYVYNEGRSNYSQVFAQMTQRDGSFLVGREDIADWDWTMLEGSHLLPGRKGGVPYMTLEWVVKQKGLVPGEDVDFDDSIAFAQMTGAFTAGTGDYFTVFEPTASMLEMEGRGYILASVGAEAGDVPFTAYFASLSYLEENAETVQKFTEAIQRGLDWVQEHTAAEIAEAVSPSFPDTDLELLTLALQRYKDIDAWCTDAVMSEVSFNNLMDIMQEAGELDTRANYNDVVNNTFAEVAAGR